MAVPIEIEFVSDVVYPWCVIGLRGLEQAIARSFRPSGSILPIT